MIAESRVESGASVGPFAHLRAGSDVREGARVGNFVEMKKTVLGAGSKAGHLSYLGDATIGAKVNIGAGAITCNYDGVAKNQTIIDPATTWIDADVAVGPDTILHPGVYLQ